MSTCDRPARGRRLALVAETLFFFGYFLFYFGGVGWLALQIGNGWTSGLGSGTIHSYVKDGQLVMGWEILNTRLPGHPQG